MAPRPLTACITFAIAALVATPVAAHDYWLQPDRFAYAPGDRLRLELWLGADFRGEASRPWQPARTRSFTLVTDHDTTPLGGRARAGVVPLLADAPLPAEGPALIGMERRWTDIALAGEKFVEYLHHEGLEQMLAVRARRGPKATERECYTRALKSLIQVGDRRSDLHARVLGHVIELVLLDDPAGLDPGGRLRARLLYRDKPLANTRVTALVRGAGGKLSQRTAATDAKGEVAFDSDAGTWLLRTVHMTPCEGCDYAEWESYWTSFTFAID